MIAIWIIAFIVVLLFLPTHIVVRHTDETEIYIRLFFFLRINILKSGKWIGKKQEKKSEPTEKKAKEKQPKKKQSLSQKLESLKAGVRIVLQSLNQFCKYFKMYRCKVFIVSAGEDPADVAIEYGAANALAFSIVEMLDQQMKIKNRDIQIYYDYNKSKTVFEFDFRFSVVLLKFLFVLICVNFRDIMTLMQNQK